MHFASYGVIGIARSHRGCHLVRSKGMVYDDDCKKDVDGNIKEEG